LSAALRRKIAEAAEGRLVGREMNALRGLLDLQQRWSSIPREDELLIEKIKTRGGFQIFVFPFEGRLVHEGLAALLAYRISRFKTTTFTMACNDHGFVLQSPHDIDIANAISRGILRSDDLLQDILHCVNATEMAKRQFRQIARVAGLIRQGFPGQRKTASHLQASSNLFFDVFAKYDPDNRLLRQSHREVLDFQLETERMMSALERIGDSRIVIETPQRVTPLAFPLLVDKLRERLSSETLAERIARMQAELEKAADAS
jgi:ATP-dependent Lhr-like helicase